MFFSFSSDACEPQAEEETERGGEGYVVGKIHSWPTTTFGRERDERTKGKRESVVFRENVSTAEVNDAGLQNEAERDF